MTNPRAGVFERVDSPSCEHDRRHSSGAAEAGAAIPELGLGRPGSARNVRRLSPGAAQLGLLRAGTADALAQGMDPLDFAPAVSLSLGAPHAGKPHPHRRAWLTSAAAGVIGCILATWGSAPTSTAQAQAAAAILGSESTSLASACDAGAALACNDLGVVSLHATPGDAALALESFQRACAGGCADGCSNLGALYEKGVGVRADLSEALALYQGACDGGAALGCSNLGALYAHGKGVARDTSEAQRLFQQACEGGSAMGCNNLMQLGSQRSASR